MNSQSLSLRLNETRERRVRKWKHEDMEIEKERAEEIEIENLAEAQVMTIKSLEENIVYEVDKFSNNNAYIKYLIQLGCTVVSNCNTKLVDNIKPYFENNIEAITICLNKHDTHEEIIQTLAHLISDEEKKRKYLDKIKNK